MENKKNIQKFNKNKNKIFLVIISNKLKQLVK